MNELEKIFSISLRLRQQTWLRMGFEPMHESTRDVPWNRGHSNPWT